MLKMLVSMLAATLIFSATCAASPRMATGTGSKSASTRVQGYTTKRGTTVAPYSRSTADRTRTNNWSTKGNTNPMTGKRGTK